MTLFQKLPLKKVRWNLISNNLNIRQYAKKTGGQVDAGMGALGKTGKKKIVAIKLERKEVPVETDTTKLVNFVCGTNLYAEGGKDVELKPDSEYPDWLWNLHTGPRKTLDQLHPDTKEYWEEIDRLKAERVESYKKWRIVLKDNPIVP